MYSTMLMVTSCNLSTNHKYDGSYSLNIDPFGGNLNSKVDIIINGDKMEFNGEIIDCKQYDDRIEAGKNKIVLMGIDGDLVVNIPMLGKARYIRVSGDNNLKL
ncbi:hypothetical protein [Flavobacterium taihuense]|uniref:Lipoprotein n=1 Tax=Flavobacterium taihuense TaxID=2857508 RepID=A0ABS6XXP5_9FLAO|nr:hypothetical protein [Flavobacterium taihuense]MBW4360664.1 hypothetical protein [Flavobacterium taihuense]